jgi:vesicle-fusing ATPase
MMILDYHIILRLTSCTIELENFRKKDNTTIDYNDITKYICEKYKNQYFCDCQKFAILHKDTRIIANIKKIICIDENTNCDIQHGKFDKNTKISLISSDENLELINIPDEVNAKQLFNINPKDLENLGIGGLNDEFSMLFRRAFVSRLLPISIQKKLNIKHSKGVLLHGPPGTGKTLIARKIGELLNCREPKIVNGPEILSKYVGESEKNIRALFFDAEQEQQQKGDKSQLHLIIFDEFDSLCKKRGMSNDGTGVGDNIVNQLLSKIFTE